jgi:hypothetical protein
MTNHGLLHITFPEGSVFLAGCVKDKGGRAIGWIHDSNNPQHPPDGEQDGGASVGPGPPAERPPG